MTEAVKRAGAKAALLAAIRGAPTDVASRFNSSPLLDRLPGASEFSCPCDSECGSVCVCASTEPRDATRCSHAATQPAVALAPSDSHEHDDVLPLLHRLIQSPSSWEDTLLRPDAHAHTHTHVHAATEDAPRDPLRARIATYTLSHSALSPLRAHTLLPAPERDASARLSRLVSSGVDATGCVRVWASTHVAAHALRGWASDAGAQSRSAASSWSRLRVCELGAGAAGLLGWTFAALAAAARTDQRGEGGPREDAGGRRGGATDASSIDARAHTHAHTHTTATDAGAASRSSCLVVLSDGNVGAARLLAEGVALTGTCTCAHTCVDGGSSSLCHTRTRPLGRGTAVVGCRVPGPSVDVASDCIVWDAEAAVRRAGLAPPSAGMMPVHVGGSAYYPISPTSSLHLHTLMQAYLAIHRMAVGGPQSLPLLYQPAPSASQLWSAPWQQTLPPHVDTVFRFQPYASPRSSDAITPITPSKAMAWLPQLSPIVEPMPPPAAGASLTRRARSARGRSGLSTLTAQGGDAALQQLATVRTSSASHGSTSSDVASSRDAASPHGSSQESTSTPSEIALPEPQRVARAPLHVGAAGGHRIDAVSSDSDSQRLSSSSLPSWKSSKGASSGQHSRARRAKYTARRATAATSYLQRYARMLRHVRLFSGRDAPSVSSDDAAAVRHLVHTSHEDDAVVAQTVLYLTDAAVKLAHGDAIVPPPTSLDDYPDFDWLAGSERGPTHGFAQKSPSDGTSDAAPAPPMLTTGPARMQVAPQPVAVPPSIALAAALATHDAGPLTPVAHDFTYNLLIASDILFFERYHDDLLHTIWVLLRHASDAALPAPTCMTFTDSGGSELMVDDTPWSPWHDANPPSVSPQAWIWAPRRGGSLDRFVRRAQRCCISSERGLARAFDVTVHAAYNADISRQHTRALAESASQYSPDIDFPLLVRLRKLPAVCL